MFLVSVSSLEDNNLVVFIILQIIELILSILQLLLSKAWELLYWLFKFTIQLIPGMSIYKLKPMIIKTEWLEKVDLIFSTVPILYPSMQLSPNPKVKWIKISIYHVKLFSGNLWILRIWSKWSFLLPIIIWIKWIVSLQAPISIARNFWEKIQV